MLEINLLVMYLIAIGIVAMVVILVIRVCGLELTWYILATLTFLFATIGGVNMWDDHRTDWISLVVSFVSALSMFTIGRVIQLLHQIRDAVRNTPALSPSRSDDE